MNKEKKIEVIRKHRKIVENILFAGQHATGFKRKEIQDFFNKVNQFKIEFKHELTAPANEIASSLTDKELRAMDETINLMYKLAIKYGVRLNYYR